MARLLSPGSTVNGHTVVEHLHTGRDALSYHARNERGDCIFLKQYKSPSCIVPWYAQYQGYQRDLADRLGQGGQGSRWACSLYSFEATLGSATFFQAFEFIDPCVDLEQYLLACSQERKPLAPAMRLALARLLLDAVMRLHGRGVVHADLKPANILLPIGPSGGTELEDLLKPDGANSVVQPPLLLADFDFAILVDTLPPWHNHQGYLGSPLYYSPEHVQNEIPRMKSDVYACGLILYELLGAGHPYRHKDNNDYLQAMMLHAAQYPALGETFRETASSDVKALQHMLRFCLHPSPAQRPELAEIAELLALLARAEEGVHAFTLPVICPRQQGEDWGKSGTPPNTPASATRNPDTGGAPATEKTARTAAVSGSLRQPSPLLYGPAAESGLPDRSDEIRRQHARARKDAFFSAARISPVTPEQPALHLEGTEQGNLYVHIRTVMGKSLLRCFGDDARYASTCQFTLSREESGDWSIAQHAEAVNDTMLNGRKIIGAVPLRDGDIIEIGREERQLHFLPITVWITGGSSL